MRPLSDHHALVSVSSAVGFSAYRVWSAKEDTHRTALRLGTVLRIAGLLGRLKVVETNSSIAIEAVHGETNITDLAKALELLVDDVLINTDGKVVNQDGGRLALQLLCSGARIIRDLPLSGLRLLILPRIGLRLLRRLHLRRDPQRLWSERHRQQLLQPHNTIPPLRIKHHNRHLQPTKFPDKLPAHPARRRRRTDVRRHSYRLEPSVAIRDGFAEGDAFGARGYWVGCVFDVGAGYVDAGVGEDRAADAEVGVG